VEVVQTCHFVFSFPLSIVSLRFCSALRGMRGGRYNHSLRHRSYEGEFIYLYIRLYWIFKAQRCAMVSQCFEGVTSVIIPASFIHV